MKFAIALLSAVALVAAVPQGNPLTAGTAIVGNINNVWNHKESKCNVGSLKCCNDVQDVKSNAVQSQAGIIGAVLGTLSGQVGLQCNPITGIGAGGANCNTQPACCDGDTFSGLVTAGCTPVNVNV